MLVTLTQAVAALQAEAAWLAARPDVRIVYREFGEPAPAALLGYFRARPALCPAELLDFYALLNGVRVEWEFAGGQQGGLLRIEPLTETSFVPAPGRPERTPEGEPALLLAQMLDDRLVHGYWLIANGPPTGWGRFDVCSGYQAQHDGHLVLIRGRAASIAEFLQQAAAAHFDLRALYPHAQDTAHRLAQPAGASPPLAPGTRVRVDLSASDKAHVPRYGRGTVLQLHTVPPGSELTRQLSFPATPTYALVRLDLEQPCWVAAERVLGLPEPAPPTDLYERYLTDPTALLRLAETAGWEPALHHMALLWGPYQGRPEDFSSVHHDYLPHCEVPAALLLRLPLPEAVELVQRVLAGADGARATLTETLQIEPAEQPLAYTAWPYPVWQQWQLQHWQLPWPRVLTLLLSGLKYRLHLAPEDERAALKPAALKALQAAARPLPWGSEENYRRFFAELRKLRLGRAYLPLYPHPDNGIGHLRGPHPDLPAPYPLVPFHRQQLGRE